MDDNETWCFVLSSFLQQNGFAVETFSYAPAFLNVAEKFDLALIDFCITAPAYQSEIDGSELIERVKARLEKRPILILVSGFFTPDLLEESQEICSHADACLSKSLGAAGLLAAIQHWLPQSQLD